MAPTNQNKFSSRSHAILQLSLKRKTFNENKNNFDSIKKKLINNEKRAEDFFKTLKTYFNIGDSPENKETMNDLTLLFNSKKYELDLKSIIYFFNCLNKDDKWNKNLSKTY